MLLLMLLSLLLLLLLLLGGSGGVAQDFVRGDGRAALRAGPDVRCAGAAAAQRRRRRVAVQDEFLLRHPAGALRAAQNPRPRGTFSFFALPHEFYRVFN